MAPSKRYSGSIATKFFVTMAQTTIDTPRTAKHGRWVLHSVAS
jgi:hypothetical protein